MITLDDFTLLSIGSRNNFDGTVARCPACGRNGVVVQPDEAPPYCVHAQASEILCDGMRTDSTDCCRIPEALYP